MTQKRRLIEVLLESSLRFSNLTLIYKLEEVLRKKTSRFNIIYFSLIP